MTENQMKTLINNGINPELFATTESLLEAIDDAIVDNIVDNDDEPDDIGIELQRIYDQLKGAK